MKYVRLTGSPPLEAVPALFRELAASPHATEARLQGLSVADGDDEAGVTLLFDVDGDREAMAGSLREAPAAERVDVAPIAPDRFYLLVDARPAAAPMLRQVFVETLSVAGIVVVTPVVYRAGEVHARLVGHADAVQAAIDGLPAVVEVTVHEVGEGGTAPGTPAETLSDRQREAVRAALELGYYDQPRAATHEDVADLLSCAPSTASEHLRKAEAKLVRAAMG